MFTVRQHLRKLVWLALTAMLALSLLPTVAHALSFGELQPDAFTEICTPQGAQWVDAQGNPVDSEAPVGNSLSFEHCPYCSLASGTAALPSAAAPVVLAVPGGTAAPPPVLRAPRTLFAWASAQPRAPPSLS